MANSNRNKWPLWGTPEETENISDKNPLIFTG